VPAVGETIYILGAGFDQCVRSPEGQTHKEDLRSAPDARVPPHKTASQVTPGRCDLSAGGTEMILMGTVGHIVSSMA
jgi:hypothetical protein